MSLPNHVFRFIEFAKYLLRAKGGHALHSPFLFRLYQDAIISSRFFRISEIELLRKRHRKSPELVEVIDFKSGNLEMKTVGSMARTSLSTPKFSALLHQLISFLEAKSVLETGTSLGINALYMANAGAHVSTIEGSQVIHSLAQKYLQRKDIRHINGDIYRVFESEIVRTQPDFYFLDADHRSSAIVFCLDLILKHTPNAKCIVIHDIYWSQDMKEIWEALVQDPRFPLSVDVFQAGLLFPNLEMQKQHFTLCF